MGLFQNHNGPTHTSKTQPVMKNTSEKTACFNVDLKDIEEKKRLELNTELELIETRIGIRTQSSNWN